MDKVTRSYSDFVDRAAQNLIPISAGIELTDGCNLRCRHCYKTDHVRKPDELSEAEWVSVLESLAEAGCLFLTLTGGEMLVRPDALRICEKARRIGFAIRIFTNGVLVDGSAAERIAALRPLSVEVSVYGPDADLHDSVTRVRGSYGRTIEGVRSLVSNGASVIMKSPVMTVNAGSIEGLLDLSRSLGAELRLDLDMVPMENGNDEPLDFRLGDAALEDVLSNPWMKERLVVFNAEPPVDEHDICGAARRTCSISSVGDVYPCNQLLTPAGNLRQRSFAEIWSDSAEMNRVRSLRIADLCETCRSCSRLGYCGRCGALALSEDGDYLGKSSWACRVAAAKEAVAGRAGGRDAD